MYILVDLDGTLTDPAAGILGSVRYAVHKTTGKEAPPASELGYVLAEANGGKLLVCTAKPATFAERVVGHFDLARHFDGIYGPDLAGNLDDKGDLIAHMIELEGIDTKRAVMIGDRGSDVKASKRHGIPAVGVKWGYGSEDELKEAGAAVIIEEPGELKGAVEGLLLLRRN